MSTANVIQPNNPANATAVPKAARKRIPMSTPERKLEVPSIEGYHLHWIKTSNIPRALRAGYDFVDSQEIDTHSLNPANDKTKSGNQSLGSHVEIAAGTDAQGHPEQLVLMKLPEEYWRSDRAQIDQRNASVMGAIFRGEKILGEETDSREDQGTRYVDKERTKAALYQRAPRRAQP